MSKKGFTLIELLAVIAILAIIAIITTPTILNVIRDSREKALYEKMYGLIDAVKLYIVQQQTTNNSGLEYGYLPEQSQRGYNYIYIKLHDEDGQLVWKVKIGKDSWKNIADIPISGEKPSVGADIRYFPDLELIQVTQVEFKDGKCEQTLEKDLTLTTKCELSS